MKNSTDIALACAFDHEEVGSESTTGADSANLGTWLKRILADLDDASPIEQSGSDPGVVLVHKNTTNRGESHWLAVLSKSMFFSIDGAHGVHPNYGAKHQNEHKPVLGKGLVVKSNVNQRYATTATTAQIFRQICKQAGCKVGDYASRRGRAR